MKEPGLDRAPPGMSRTSLILSGLLVASCAQDSGLDGKDEPQSIERPALERPALERPALEPRTVGELRDLGIGSVTWTIMINGADYRQDLIAGESESVLTIPLSRLDQPVNEVVVSFDLTTDGGERYSLAVADYRLNAPATGDTIRLSGLNYRYTDSDNDGIHDVHELSVSPVDLDADRQPNVFDSDSDGDAIPDGDDPSPYDGAASDGNTATARSFDLVEADGTRRQISVAANKGPASARDHLINTLGEAMLKTAPGWPDDIVSPMDASRTWTAYGLDGGADALCPEWRIAKDTSALRARLSRAALFFFERSDNSAFLAAMANADIADLDSLDNEINDSVGRGAWNDALRLILVPTGTVGWVELTTDASFGGETCVLNLTSSLP